MIEFRWLGGVLQTRQLFVPYMAAGGDIFLRVDGDAEWKDVPRLPDFQPDHPSSDGNHALPETTP